MSADNRIIKDNYNGKWYVWHGSLSQDYYKPTSDAICFDAALDATNFAIKESDSCAVLEGGIQSLTDNERIRALQYENDNLRMQLDIIKKPVYCPTCGACGEEGCCPASMCQHGFCLYGKHYAKDHTYYRLMTERLYDLATELDKDRLKKIFDACYDEAYGVVKIENKI